MILLGSYYVNLDQELKYVLCLSVANEVNNKRAWVIMFLPGTRNPECKNESNDFKTCGSANSQTEFINKSDCINERNDETFSQ